MKRPYITLTVVIALALLILLHSVYPAERESVEVFFSPRGDANKAIKKAINEAKSEVLVAMFHFTSFELAQALYRAHRRGVEVIIVLDRYLARGKGSQTDYLVEKGIDVRYMKLPYAEDVEERPKFHHKFAVIDGRTVVTGSYNWTVFAETKNYENVVIIHSQGVASKFQKEFRGRILPNTVVIKPDE